MGQERPEVQAVMDSATSRGMTTCGVILRAVAGSTRRRHGFRDFARNDKVRVILHAVAGSTLRQHGYRDFARNDTCGSSCAQSQDPRDAGMHSATARGMTSA